MVECLTVEGLDGDQRSGRNYVRRLFDWVCTTCLVKRATACHLMQASRHKRYQQAEEEENGIPTAAISTQHMHAHSTGLRTPESNVPTFCIVAYSDLYYFVTSLVLKCSPGPWA